LLIDADGRGCFIEAAHGTLLGVGRSQRPTTVVPFLTGQTLLMFTDGLIERRGEDLEVSKKRLLDACGAAFDAVTDAELDRLAQVMRDPTRDDDVALLAVHRVDEPWGPAARGQGPVLR
jgi:serine phosphatase RsbU (regulator of sigma subunit)